MLRVFTGRGCSLVPSFMKGHGRQLDEMAYLNYYTHDAEIVLIVDVRNLPSIRVVELLGCDIAKSNIRSIPNWFGPELFSNSQSIKLDDAVKSKPARI